MMLSRWIASSLLLTIGVGLSAHAQNSVSGKVQASGSVTASAAEPVTFTKNVAPILQQKCQVCHQPNSIAPMSLLTYQDTKDYADEIREYVSNRVMPPWHIDRTVGIHDFKNDRGLS